MTDPVNASAVRPRKVDWLWRERIAKGTLTFVGGKPDQGKGLFASYLAADVSARGGNVLYSSIEEAFDMMTRPRLQAAGADLDRVVLWRFALPTQLREVENMIIDREIDLVLMDPFAAHLRGVSRFSDDVREVLTPLTSLIEQTGTAVVVIEHALKRVPHNTHPLNAIGGTSSGLVAACRMGYLLGVHPDDGDRRVLACVKSNLRERPKAVEFELDVEEQAVVGEVPSLTVTQEIEFDAMRIATSVGPPGKPGRRPDKRAEACEWLTTYLLDQGKAVKSTTLMEDAKQHGFTSRTIRRAADDMGIVRNPAAGGPNCTWDLSPKLKVILGVADEEEVSEATKQEAGADEAAGTGSDELQAPEEAQLASEVDIDAEFADLLDGKKGKKGGGKK